MKFPSILAAASLALAPVIASAGSGPGSAGSADSADSAGNGGRPVSGPLAGRVLDRSAVPAGAIILGGLVLIGGVVIAVIGGSDSNNNTND